MERWRAREVLASDKVVWKRLAESWGLHWDKVRSVDSVTCLEMFHNDAETRRQCQARRKQEHHWRSSRVHREKSKCVADKNLRSWEQGRSEIKRSLCGWTQSKFNKRDWGFVTVPKEENMSAYKNDVHPWPKPQQIWSYKVRSFLIFRSRLPCFSFRRHKLQCLTSTKTWFQIKNGAWSRRVPAWSGPNGKGSALRTGALFHWAIPSPVQNRLIGKPYFWLKWPRRSFCDQKNWKRRK